MYFNKLRYCTESLISFDILSKESLVYTAEFQLVKIIISERFSWIHVTHQVTHVDNTELRRRKFFLKVKHILLTQALFR